MLKKKKQKIITLLKEKKMREEVHTIKEGERFLLEPTSVGRWLIARLEGPVASAFSCARGRFVRLLCERTEDEK